MTVSVGTLLSALEDEGFIETGDLTLDKYLGGGICKMGITDIAGESSVGKSSLCLQIAAKSLYNSINADQKIIFISTQEKFPLKRFEQITAARYGDVDLKQNLILAEAFVYEKFISLLNSLRDFQKYNKVQMIIIDSIAACFREEKLDDTELNRIMIMLKQYSFDHKIPIICSNQMTQAPDDSEAQPSLGLNWTLGVNTRILLTRRRNSHTRFLRVLFDSYSVSCNDEPLYFTIEDYGAEFSNDL